MIKKILMPLFIFSSVNVSANCQVPSDLNGITLTNLISPLYNEINPNAGAIAHVTYSEDKYVTNFINRDLGPFEGYYKYKILDTEKGISLYEGYESLPLNKPSHTILFKCKTDTSGLAIFTQSSGINEPSVRQNSIEYNITNRSE
ncbi:hypothetical protein [Vibrio owensii]|jgi:hypothetical protein|uniref:hypothetical protein n=1 Tax=Vibrio owensii TaxID=696485 RepID=UPI000C9995D0|nr:hypothetical protein [Vibrio owensii]